MRLETLGFQQVYDYAAGKEDWIAAALPSEGHALEHPRVKDAISDVPTCRLSDNCGEARAKLREGLRPAVVVTNDDGVVLGRLRKAALEGDPSLRVEDAMDIGPTTFRPSVDLQALIDRMHERKVGSVIVTNAGGQLLGMLYRDEGEKVLAQH